ncbi:helix-turn-helix domain-containing protein [Streptomyces sp. ITFR-16]|uniref:helix-turn-helix domain-containing protein n=1 Tax=Streptomyces sp. ITFR-16 TaxID=3075198 RepID=UPI00288B0469|nr:helix-turn-helix domain-containing protein [Streptomyces sp. ITFR-16]WNI26961.1 helix-turn-helix domain-containing protein [Streptomyces sp. ITFR-16]
MNGLARTGGSKELLRWVSGRAEGWAGLVDGDGSVLHGVARVPERTSAAAAALASSGARELTALGARSLSVDQGPHTALMFSLDGPADVPPPVLAVVARRPLPAGLATLLADAALPLTMCWAAESVERKRRRVDLAESRGREAVLHLLMTGQLSIAHQVAGALRPSLPDPVRVCVVECPGRGRDEVARVCADLSGGRSWIVRCPVYARHLILVVPAGPDPADERLGPEVASVVDDCVVGISEDVPLADTATAYRQAFHALAVARGLAERHARFGAAPEPALVAGAEGARWADALLAPLLTHLPRRSQDPGSQELAATLASWLAFSSHATEHLKIHRNTLAARLRLIGEVLGLDLHRVADQAALDLALRVRATPALPRRAETAAAASPALSPDALLRLPAMRSWAVQQLRPLDLAAAGGGGADPHTTLRTWLAHEAQIGPAAEALDISVPGLRKRLTRLETVLGRSLLRPPSARYDLWLAFRSLDLTEGGQPYGGRPRP